MSILFKHRKDSVEKACLLGKGYLEKVYVDEGKSTREIAKILDISQPIVRKLLAVHKIPARTYKDNKTPVAKGSKRAKEICEKISIANKGNTSGINPETGKSWKFSRVKISCSFCGKETEKKKYMVNDDKNSFCSMTCHGRWRSENYTGENNPIFSRKKVPCLECGKLVLCQGSRIKRGRIFCDRSCVGMWRSKHQTGATRYNWTGGYKGYYGESWPAAKRLTRKRDNYTCQNCFKDKVILKKNPDVHHIKPFREFGLSKHLEANQPTNLICYCNVRHKTIEEKTNKITKILDFQI
jgi:5-methylcytosine-specific restriction endonuclease McrA